RSLLAAMQDNVELRADKDVPDVTFFGPCALELDLTPESTRRYDDNARSIAAMADLCARHGARLLVVQTSHALYSVFLDERLQRVAPELPVLHLDGYLPPPFTLGIDPHANAATCDVRARWIAADLLERGWIDRGAGGELPAVPPAYAALLPPDRTPEQVLAEAAQARERVPAALLTEIDLRSGRGMRQVIGGVNLDMTLRMHALFALRAGGPVLRVELDPLPDRPDLYPLEVGVEVGGLGAGSITVQAAQRAVKDFALPDAVRPGTPFEVKLLPATWCVQTVRGRSQVVCLASARLSCPPPP
ncbi:MAG TPA: hypothetical protein VK824_04075, partial [Planctomycetota bacterium]|nr:hypothetical protein [Planctomycetota bacterium]